MFSYVIVSITVSYNENQGCIFGGRCVTDKQRPPNRKYNSASLWSITKTLKSNNQLYNYN